MAALIDHASHASLASRRRDRPARQRTLRDTVAWSYSLLDQRTQRLFRCLSVFAQGFTLEAVETVTADASVEVDLLAGIVSLVDASLLRAKPDLAGPSRFSMLETIRAVAAELLSETDDAVAMREAHAHFYLAFAEGATAPTAGTRPDAMLAGLGVEIANLRVALGWLLEVGDGEHLLRLSVALADYWFRDAHLAEGRAWLARALTAAPAATPLRIRAVTWASALAWSARGPGGRPQTCRRGPAARRRDRRRAGRSQGAA